MSKVIYIFKKDCLRFRWHLLTLAVVLGLLYLRVTRPPSAAIESADTEIDLLINLFLDALLVVFAALIVLEDPAAGEGAAWKTRPVRLRQLLAGKALFILLFLMLAPIGLQLLALQHLGADHGLFAAAAAASFFEQLPKLLLAAALASLCRSLPVFVLAATLTLTAVIIYLLSVLQYVPHDVALSQRLLSLFFLSLTAGIALLHQYRTGSAGRSAIILISSMLATQLAIHLIPTNRFWGLQAQLVSSSPVDFRLRVPEIPWERHLGSSWTARASSDRIQLYIPVQPISDPACDVTVSSVRSRLRLPGRILTQWGGGGTFAGNAKDTVHLLPIGDLIPGDFERWKEMPVAVESRLFFRAGCRTTLAQVPLDEGSRFEDGLLRFQVRTIELSEKRLRLVFQGRRMSIRAPFDSPPLVAAEAMRFLSPIDPQLVHSSRPLRFNTSGTGRPYSVRSVILGTCQVIDYVDDKIIAFDSDPGHRQLRNDALRGVDEAWLGEARVSLTLPSVVLPAFTQELALSRQRLEDLSLSSWEDHIYRRSR